jgi:hypothetical protein
MENCDTCAEVNIIYLCVIFPFCILELLVGDCKHQHLFMNKHSEIVIVLVFLTHLTTNDIKRKIALNHLSTFLGNILMHLLQNTL